MEVCIDGVEYISNKEIQVDGWYSNCVPLPALTSDVQLEFWPDGESQTYLLSAGVNKWIGEKWTLTPLQRTGHHGDRWRIS